MKNITDWHTLNLDEFLSKFNVNLGKGLINSIILSIQSNVEFGLFENRKNTG